MKGQDVIKDGKTLARIVRANEWSEGLNFFSLDNESIQVGAWKYDAGLDLKRHIHNEVPRQIARTQEVLFVKKGRITAEIYTLDEIFVEKTELVQGDILILFNCGHGYKILEDGTEVLEVKNGPYPGADADRRRF